MAQNSSTRSWVHDLVEIFDGHGICSICGIEIKRGKNTKNTTNIMSHLRGKHPEVAAKTEKAHLAKKKELENKKKGNG